MILDCLRIAPERAGASAAVRCRPAAVQCALSIIGALLVCVILTGCNGSDSSPDQSGHTADEIIDDAIAQSASDTRPEVLQALVSDPDLLAGIPGLVNYTVLADSGIQVAYTDAAQSAYVTAQVIESHWQSMQDCLGQTASAPLVLVREGLVEPFLPDDLVLFYFSVPVASATVRNSAVLQISDSDFDGSLGAAGFYLRSIMGRFLWTAANLAVSDYPHRCASQLEAGF